MPRHDVTAAHVGGFAVASVPRAESVVHTRVVPDPEAFARGGTVLRESMSRVTARVLADGLGAVLLKFHKRPRRLRALRHLVARGRSRMEWDAARYLAGAGLPVPEALAMGEERRMRLLGRSFFLARFEDGLRDLATTRADQPPEQAKRLDARVARLIRTMHDLGFDHRDLHPGNVLAGPGPGEACRLRLVDLHRVRLGQTVSRRGRVRSLAYLHAYMTPPSSESTLRSWLQAYEPDEEQRSLWVEHVMRDMRRLRAVRRKSRARRCMVDSTIYTRDVPLGTGARRRDVDPEAIEYAIDTHRHVVAHAAGKLLKQSERSRVSRVDGIVVKEALAGGGWRGLRHRLVPRLDQSGYRNAHRLMNEGVGTARPLAIVQTRGHTYTLYDELVDCRRLDHLAREMFLNTRSEDRARLLRASAAWVGNLHARGIYHGDLKGVNILVQANRGAFSFHLIDTDHCRFFDEPVDTRRRIKNLAQLAASIPISVTKCDRLRWFRDYAHVSGLTRSRSLERDYARRVQEALDRKIVVIDEPIE